MEQNKERRNRPIQIQSIDLLTNSAGTGHPHAKKKNRQKRKKNLDTDRQKKNQIKKKTES